MAKKALFALLLLGATLVFCGCARTAEQKPKDGDAVETQEPSGDTTEDLEGLDANALMIKEAVGIDADRAKGASETLAGLEVGELVSAERLGDDTYETKVTAADGRCYFLEFSQMGYLQVVRADATDGEVVWAVID